tara:strand:- start:385 stop:735 length:351 start_codon:yes stop_codon:yes gene_type:complete
MEFKGIRKSKNKNKKYDAIFYDKENNKTKGVSFGQAGASDYTVHKDEIRRNRYISRHWKDLKTNNPMAAGYLSMYILWNKNNLRKSVLDYKRRYNIYLKSNIFPLKIDNMPNNLLK